MLDLLLEKLQLSLAPLLLLMRPINSLGRGLLLPLLLSLLLLLLLL
jgi:hypothetical protein